MIFESLEKHSPDIAKEWDYERNSPLLPDQVGHGSTKKVFWICEKGHSYEARIDHRTIMHSGCPYCGGKRIIKGQNDLLTVFPDVAAEWDYDKNGDLRPEAITPGSDIKVWWICRTCNNSWQAKVSSRTANGNGCPECGKRKCVVSFQNRRIKEKGSLAETRPDIAAQWDYEANAPLTPNDVTIGSNKKIAWICPKGHKWRAAIYTRRKCGCPRCAGKVQSVKK